jgi:hypothetical protein
MLSNAQYIQGVQDYHAPRTPEEVDLVSWMRDRLLEAGLADEVVNNYDTSHYIIEARDKNSRVQLAYAESVLEPATDGVSCCIYQ